MTTVSREYLSVTETAGLVRQALKQAFPAVKFSVRSKSYAGGASINVQWTDGPRTKRVGPIIERFEGKQFDGMIDFGYGVEHYLKPDGTPYLRHDPGTGGQLGSIPETDNRHLDTVMPEGVRRVRFGADYVFSRRDISDEENKIAQVTAWLREHCVIEKHPTDTKLDRFGNRWLSDLARNMAHDWEDGEDVRTVFDRN